MHKMIFGLSQRFAMLAGYGAALAIVAMLTMAQINPGTSPLSIGKGGTGATTALGARTNLGITLPQTGTWTAPAATSRTVGGGNGNHFGMSFVAPASGAITTVKINAAAVTVSATFEARLYTNNSGSPGTQVGTASGTVTISTTGEKTFTFATSPSMTNGTTYWMVLAVTSGTPTISVSTVTNQAGFLSGRDNTITSIVDNLPSSEDWKMEINYQATVSLSSLDGIGNNTIVGNNSGSTAAPSALTAAQATAVLNNCVGDSGSGGTKGLVPAPGAGDAAAAKYLKADCTWDVPAGGGGGGGGMTDDERRNSLLLLVYQSKLLAEYRRVIKTFATGFKGASDTLNGIVTGSSSGYTVNTSSGYVAPTAGSSGTTGTWSATAASSRTVGGGNGNNFGMSFVAPASANIDTIRVTVPTVTTGATFEARLYTNNSGSPGTQVGTASGTVTISTTGDKTFTFGTPPAMTNGTTYWLVVALTSGTPSIAVSTVTNQAGYGSGRNDTITSITDGLPSSEDWKMEINYSSSASNLVVVTSAQTTSSSVSNGRVLMEFDNAATPTLNTDLTAEVTCNGGTNWAAATLSAVGFGQAGRSVAETADTACTSGTSIQARIKTFNSKNVPIYGVALIAH